MVKILLLFFLIITSSAWALEKPGPQNTGYVGSLTSSGGFTVTEDNAVYENLDIAGNVVVKASGVIIRNCRIDAEGRSYGVDCRKDASDVLIENCEILNASSSMVIGSGFTLRKCEIWDGGSDGVKPFNNFVIESNWIHRLGKNPGAHADGVQMVSGKNGIIRGNFFDMEEIPGYENSQCIILNDNNNPVVNIKVIENWFNGGGYSVQILLGVLESELSDNIFTQNFKFGPIRNNTAGALYISCNRWESDGSFLPNQSNTDNCGTGTPGGGLDIAETPVLSLPSGIYWSVPENIMITTTTQPSTIRYTDDGTNPDSSSAVVPASGVVLNSSKQIRARVFADGYLDSFIASENYEVGELASVDDWQNVELPVVINETINPEVSAGLHGWGFTATPDSDNLDCVIALSGVQASQYADCAVICRFRKSSDGSPSYIDARDGGSYRKIDTLIYTADTNYEFVVTVNFIAKTYSVKVRPEGGGFTTIAEDFAFRNEQQDVESLRYMASTVLGTGRVFINNFIESGPPSAPPAPNPPGVQAGS